MLPPTPFDEPFKKADSVKTLQDALLNDATFKKALTEAVTAYAEVENQNPKVVGPSAAQAARRAFQDALAG